tara:strand:- start:1323 stop:1508 length:186 start_codon:yes stop_codon:yes gene_type:complete
MREGLELDILVQALRANLVILNKVMNDMNVNNKRKILLGIVIELRTLCDNVIKPLKKDSGI